MMERIQGLEHPKPNLPSPSPHDLNPNLAYQKPKIPEAASTNGKTTQNHTSTANSNGETIKHVPMSEALSPLGELQRFVGRPSLKCFQLQWQFKRPRCQLGEYSCQTERMVSGTL